MGVVVSLFVVGVVVGVVVASAFVVGVVVVALAFAEVVPFDLSPLSPVVVTDGVIFFLMKACNLKGIGGSSTVNKRLLFVSSSIV